MRRRFKHCAPELKAAGFFEKIAKALVEMEVRPCTVSAATGISPTMLINYLNGRTYPKRETAKKLLEYFGIVIEGINGYHD